MVVGDEGTLDGGADEPVVPGAGVEGEQALHDTGRRPPAFEEGWLVQASPPQATGQALRLSGH